MFTRFSEKADTSNTRFEVLASMLTLLAMTPIPLFTLSEPVYTVFREGSVIVSVQLSVPLTRLLESKYLRQKKVTATTRIDNTGSTAHMYLLYLLVDFVITKDLTILNIVEPVIIFSTINQCYEHRISLNSIANNSICYISTCYDLNRLNNDH